MYESDSHLLTDVTYGHTVDESHNNNEEQNKIEWKSIRRKFLSQRCNPENFKMIAVVLGIL